MAQSSLLVLVNLDSFELLARLAVAARHKSADIYSASKIQRLPPISLAQTVRHLSERLYAKLTSPICTGKRDAEFAMLSQASDLTEKA